MERTGRERIKRSRNGGEPAKCISCGGKGVFRVTFEDKWGKVIVTLCEGCAYRKYEELNLQSRIKWPGVA